MKVIRKVWKKANGTKLVTIPICTDIQAGDYVTIETTEDPNKKIKKK